jgi:hypothetical protein
MDALSRALARNFTMRRIPAVADLRAEFLRELDCAYRVPHVRLVARTRVMCQAGRARAARCGAAAWLCERAPLWVVVRVCALLRDAK